MTAASDSTNNLPTQINLSNPLHLEVTEAELVRLARVEFSPYQQWVCATTLAYLLKDHPDGRGYVQTRRAASGVRNYSEELYILGEDLLTEHSRPHILDDGVGTNAFAVLGQKGYLKHHVNYLWQLTPKFQGMVSRLRALIDVAESEADEELALDSAPTEALGVDPLEGLSVKYMASGHTVPRELFKDLEEQGVRGLTLKFEYQGSEVTPDRFLLSLLDSRS